MTSESTVAIDIDQLLVTYRGKPAVNRLSLTIPRGSVYALLGENGAGKSSTMKVLTGLVKPNGGRAKILGLDSYANAYELRYRVGYVPERPKFYDWMRVSEIGWFSAGFHKTGYLEHYNEWVQKLELNPTKRLKELSKGGYARVGLALALAGDPQVLLLDEPTSGLDLVTRREFLTSLVELAAEGRTILISSHSISELERFASHAAFVQHGQVKLAASLEELREMFCRLEFRTSEPIPEDLSLGTVLKREQKGKFQRWVVQNPDPEGIAVLRGLSGVSEFLQSVMSLEDVYLTLNDRVDQRRIPAPVRQRSDDSREAELYEEGV